MKRRLAAMRTGQGFASHPDLGQAGQPPRTTQAKATPEGLEND